MVVARRSVAWVRTGACAGAPAVVILLASPSTVFAHDPILSCFENKTGAITCEAGYSDGAPSAGQAIRVSQTNKRLILENKFGKDSSFTFKKPDVPFVVEFVGDSSHRATFDSEDLGQ
jgi:hypothetical protein